jgi:peroxiredoxin
MYEEKGAQIIAVAVQSQEEAVTSVEKSGAQFPILADSEHAVAEIYGVTGYSLKLSNSNKAEGAVFIIDPDSKIVWEYIAKTQTDRAQSETILENLP